MRKESTTSPQVTVFIGEAMWLELFSLNQKHQLIEKFINKERFRVAHTDLTYRQINYLDNAGLLGIGREVKDKKWRLFKFRDVVYLNILNELKRFDIRNDKLSGLHNAFYRMPYQNMDEVILACLVGVEMTLIFGHDGTGFIFNPGFLTAYDENELFREGRAAAEIRLTINSVVNEALKSLKKPPAEIRNSMSKLASISIVYGGLTEIEQRVLETIRDESYEQIKLRKKDGKPAIIYATSNSGSNITEAGLLAEVSKRNFTDVIIKKRNGKVVNYQLEETIKL